ncbi:hypothetical protein G6L12_08550 [Agrobacterium rhizogenes]|nr:hypothetical protein [Rhizobium rhizogenes]NTF74522.1 hypothetical protein [Rhizobium rhizogenes]
MSFADIVSIEDNGADPYGDPIENLNAINGALGTGAPVVIPAKPFPFSGTINVPTRGQMLFGLGNQSQLYQHAPNTDAVVLAQSALAEVICRDFMIFAADGVDFSQGGVGVKSLYCGNIRIEGVSVVRMHCGSYIDTQTNVNTSDIYLNNFHAIHTVEDGIIFNNCIQAYATNSSAKSCGGNGAKIVDGSACHLDHFLSLSNAICGVKVWTSVNATTDWHFFDQLECDGNGIDGIRAINTKGLQVSNSWAGSSGQVGWNFLSGNSQLLMNNTTAKKNGAHGLYACDLTDSGIANFAGNWNGHSAPSSAAVMINGACSGVSISNPIVSEMLAPKTQAFGIRVAGASNDIQVTGGRSRGNLTAQYYNDSTGSGNRVTGLLGYN